MKMISIPNNNNIWLETMQPVLISSDLSQMIFISQLPEMPSGQSMAFPHIFLTKLGEEPDMQREVTAGQMEVREIVGWDRDQQIM